MNFVSGLRRKPGEQLYETYDEQVEEDDDDASHVTVKKTMTKPRTTMTIQRLKWTNGEEAILI